MSGNTTVVPVGTKGEGEVLSAKEANFLLGGKGHIYARAVSMNVRGQKIKLAGSLDTRNGSRGRIVRGATFLVCLDEDLFFIVADKRADDPLPEPPVAAATGATAHESATALIQSVPVYPYEPQDRSYATIAPVEALIRKASLFHNQADQSKIYDELWERAQRLAADAVINARYGVGELGGTIATGMAVRFTGDAARTPVASQLAESTARQGASADALAIHNNSPNWIDGTQLQLVATSEISSKNAKPGSRFNLRLNEPVCVDGEIAIPAGASAWAEVDAVEKSGGGSKNGSLNFHLLHIDTKWGPVPLRSVQDAVGTVDRVAESVVQANFGWIGLMFFKGRNGALKAGDLVPAYIISGHRAVKQPALLVIQKGDGPC